MCVVAFLKTLAGMVAFHITEKEIKLYCRLLTAAPRKKWNFKGAWVFFVVSRDLGSIFISCLSDFQCPLQKVPNTESRACLQHKTRAHFYYCCFRALGSHAEPYNPIRSSAASKLWTEQRKVEEITGFTMQSVVPYCNHMSCLESRRLEKSWKTAMPLVLLLGISDGQVPVRGVRKIERTEQKNNGLWLREVIEVIVLYGCHHYVIITSFCEMPLDPSNLMLSA